MTVNHVAVSNQTFIHDISKNQRLNVQSAKDVDIFPPQKKHLLIGFLLLLLLLLVVGIGVGVYMIGGSLRIIFRRLFNIFK